MEGRYNKNIGDWGEEKAVEFLRRNNFEIKDRQYHTPWGEIDIVAEKGGDYYFVEVKTRLDADLANNSAVTYQKVQKLLKSIRVYAYKNKLEDIGLIPAALVIYVNVKTKTIKFTFNVIY
ncbi:MAG TPA: YraN family protein [Candidatus Magasanikbacteria bacterium]|nr:YraN family protein [Candidatus Magasanikbacteria bacterium]